MRGKNKQALGYEPRFTAHHGKGNDDSAELAASG